LAPVGIRVSSIVLVLLVLIRGLEPTSSLRVPSGAEDVFYHLSRLNALNGLLLGFIGVGDRRPQYVLNYSARESFDEEFNGLQIRNIVACHTCEAFEVVGVLVDL